MPLNLRILKAGVAEDRFHIWEDRTHKMEENCTVFSAGEANHHVPVPVVIPLDDSRLANLDLSFQW